MISNTPSSPYLEDPEFPAFPQDESWENFLELKNSTSNNFPPHSPGHISEILFEKPPSSPVAMDLENDNDMEFNKELYFRNFIEDYNVPEADDANRRPEALRVQFDQDQRPIENEGSECSRCHSDEELEDTGSISTKDTFFELSTVDDDRFSIAWDDTFSTTSEPAYDIEADFRTKAMNFIERRPREEREYIMKAMPMLVSSLREMHVHNPLPLTDEMVRTIIKDFLYGKELMIGAERQVMREMVEREARGMRESRPREMITEDDLMIHKRKEKKAAKGNRNSSNLNHMNENYVSNIFQFAKRVYPGDREIQKIGNERNVSASNFRSMMSARLTDDIMARKAKARVTGIGRELIGNIEYWMKDGYFEQCADREKYIWHKEKALRDLALAGQY